MLVFAPYVLGVVAFRRLFAGRALLPLQFFRDCIADEFCTLVLADQGVNTFVHAFRQAHKYCFHIEWWSPHTARFSAHAGLLCGANTLGQASKNGASIRREVLQIVMPPLFQMVVF